MTGRFSPQQLLEIGREARDRGMAQALVHAERETRQWGRTALRFLYRYALSHERFMGWHVTSEAQLTGAVPTPPTTRAWGRLYHEAQKRGWIEKDGTAEHPKRHGCDSPVWRSLVFKRAA